MNLPGPAHAHSADAPARPAALRALLALAVVFLMLTTTGWTAVYRPASEPSPREAALASWAASRFEGRALPAPDAPAPVVERFFARLDGAQRARLAEGHPLVVGNLDGAPPGVRYRANRMALQRAVLVESARAHDITLAPADRAVAARRAHRFESLAEPGRQILVFDPTGGALVAEVFGDLGGARRVSVVVPGVDTDALTFERTVRRLTSPWAWRSPSTGPSARPPRTAGPRSSPGPATPPRPASAWTRRPGASPWTARPGCAR